ncbi:MAG: FecR domain-containing protein [Candidatus Tectimicrobiota bacterium]
MRSLHARPLTLLLLGLLAVIPSQSWGQQAERLATVVAVDGKAEVRAANSTQWEPLQFRALLFEKDTVRTGPDSKVKVLMRDDSILTLAERSEMEFSEFLLTPQQRRSVLGLAVGKLRVVTSKIFGAGSGTEVRTANTVAGVRGTTFVVIFIPPSTTEVVGLDGVVTVRHLNPAIPQIEPLQQNFRTRIVGNSPPSQAEVLSAEERQALESELRLVEHVPVEIQPTGQAPATGTIRGESLDALHIERHGSLSLRLASGQVGESGLQPGLGLPGRQAPRQDLLRLPPLPRSTERLDALTERAQTVQATQAFEPPGRQGIQVITPDNTTSVTTLQNTTPQTLLTITITIPRN